MNVNVSAVKTRGDITVKKMWIEFLNGFKTDLSDFCED